MRAPSRPLCTRRIERLGLPHATGMPRSGRRHPYPVLEESEPPTMPVPLVAWLVLGGAAVASLALLALAVYLLTR